MLGDLMTDYNSVNNGYFYPGTNTASLSDRYAYTNEADWLDVDIEYQAISEYSLEQLSGDDVDECELWVKITHFSII